MRTWISAVLAVLFSCLAVHAQQKKSDAKPPQKAIVLKAARMFDGKGDRLV